METFSGANSAEDARVYVGTAAKMSNGSSSSDSTVCFAFHNDDPNGIRRGMTRGRAVYASAIGGYYNRPTNSSTASLDEGLYFCHLLSFDNYFRRTHCMTS